ncbi:hypothetical protein E2986_10675 [Frieseomelitta varia]|uniref:Uncharacterized protein n=1 Tax=Frieseomelitta varia TaxID=561572 RepID=A0A833VP30_9HYME|nr:hypothetical protein E2986_10675 [Frieseomelitta varia]
MNAARHIIRFKLESLLTRLEVESILKDMIRVVSQASTGQEPLTVSRRCRREYPREWRRIVSILRGELQE